jgi:2'-5' RNA ligase
VAIDAIERYIAETLEPYPEFSVELSKVLSFPATNVLYLGVESGSDVLRQLHVALNTGELHYREAYDFTPHVTVAGPFEAAALPPLLERAVELWTSSEAARSFLVRELVLLWMDNDARGWEPLRSFTLRKTQPDLLATAANQT